MITACRAPCPERAATKRYIPHLAPSYVQLHPSTQYGNALYADSAERLKQYWDVNHAGLEPYRVCWGRYWDAKLPFSDFLGEGNHGQDYTNGELMQIFQPTNPDLPFVYHNLRWDHCPAADH